MDILLDAGTFVYDTIMDELTMYELVIMAKLSKGHQAMVAGYFYGRLKRVVAPFGLEADKLLGVMKRNHAVIGGSVAILLLHPQMFKPRNIDIYVPSIHSASLLVELIATTSYAFYRSTKYITKPAGTNPSIKSCYWLKNAITGGSIQITVVHGFDPLMAIFRADATHAKTFITHAGVVCAYPRLTLAKMSLISSRGGGGPQVGDTAKWLEKSEARGFTLKGRLADMPGNPSHYCALDASCPKTARRMRDSHMMYTSFKVDDRPVRHALWMYTGDVVWGLWALCNADRGRDHITAINPSEGGYIFDLGDRRNADNSGE